MVVKTNLKYIDGLVIMSAVCFSNNGIAVDYNSVSDMIQGGRR